MENCGRFTLCLKIDVSPDPVNVLSQVQNQIRLLSACLIRDIQACFVIGMSASKNLSHPIQLGESKRPFLFIAAAITCLVGFVLPFWVAGSECYFGPFVFGFIESEFCLCYHAHRL